MSESDAERIQEIDARICWLETNSPDADFGIGRPAEQEVGRLTREWDEIIANQEWS